MTTRSSARRSFPTLRLLAAPFRWFFRSRRRVQTAAAILAAIIAAPVVWWSIQLLGLPDIGEPFDVRAFRSFSIPDETNAFVLYRQAADRLKPLYTSNIPHDRKIDPNVRWSQADPLVHRWAEEHREAMELYRRGSERPDALDPDVTSDPHPQTRMMQPLRLFQTLALLEASRLEEAGDMAGAWTWYRTALRATRHLGRHGTAVMRLVEQSLEKQLCERVSAWAADRRTTPDLIRRAIDDVIACESLRPSESYTLKAEFMSLETLFDGPQNPGREQLIDRIKAELQSRGYLVDPDPLHVVADAWRFWRREPERSRRVLRLVIANWLAYWDLPPDRRPSPDPGITGPNDFYAFGPDAPAGARAIAPEALERWLGTTYEAQTVLSVWGFRGLRIRERSNHRLLVVLLANELYRRDHGSDPPSDEALVGPYLKALPADGAGPAGAPTAGERAR
jgi:hypothetical protein